MKVLCLFALLALAHAHSWPENPRPRQYRNSRSEGCVEDETGKVYPICGKDANGLDILNLRPSSFLQAPCTFSRANAGYDDKEFSRTVIRLGTDICVSWAANAHDGDIHRNAGATHGVRFAISAKANPSMADFDAGVLGYLPYEKFEGALLKVPLHMVPVPGEYTVLFSWDWPVGMGPKFMTTNNAKHLFARCSDIVVLPAEEEEEEEEETDNQAQKLEQEQELLLSNWPAGTHVRPVPRNCAAGSHVYGSTRWDGNGSGGKDADSHKYKHADSPHQCPPAHVNVDWKLGMSATEQTIRVRVGGTVTFTWSGHHNVAETTKMKYASCDTAGATVLSDAHDHTHNSDDAHRRSLDGHGGKTSSFTYTAPSSAGTKYMVCEVGGHCFGNQKVTVAVEVCDENMDTGVPNPSETQTPLSPTTLPPSKTPATAPPSENPGAAPPFPPCANCQNNFGTDTAAYCNYNGHCYGGSHKGKCCDPNGRAKCKCKVASEDLGGLDEEDSGSAPSGSSPSTPAPVPMMPKPVCVFCDAPGYCNYNGHCHGGSNAGKCCDPNGRAKCNCVAETSNLPTPGPAPLVPAPVTPCAQCGSGAYCNHNGHCHGGDREGECCNPHGRATCACTTDTNTQEAGGLLETQGSEHQHGE